MKRSRFTQEQIIGVLKVAPGRCDGSGSVPQARDQRGGVLRLAVEVRGGWRSPTPAS
jgi:hypothetical protein